MLTQRAGVLVPPICFAPNFLLEVVFLKMHVIENSSSHEADVGLP